MEKCVSGLNLITQRFEKHVRLANWQLGTYCRNVLSYLLALLCNHNTFKELKTNSANETEREYDERYNLQANSSCYKTVYEYLEQHLVYPLI